MNRRLYFLFPDASQARYAVEDLRKANMEESRIHAVARPGIDLSSLPAATRRQTTDACCAVENTLWRANLALFFLASAGLVASLLWSFSTGWTVLALAIMGISFLAGERFASKVPRTHLKEFRDALTHGEILLMVDVARDQVAEVENLVHRKHPAALAGGVGWSPSALGL